MGQGGGQVAPPWEDAGGGDEGRGEREVCGWDWEMKERES